MLIGIKPTLCHTNNIDLPKRAYYPSSISSLGRVEIVRRRRQWPLEMTSCFLYRRSVFFRFLEARGNRSSGVYTSNFFHNLYTEFSAKYSTYCTHILSSRTGKSWPKLIPKFVTQIGRADAAAALCHSSRMSLFARQTLLYCIYFFHCSDFVPVSLSSFLSLFCLSRVF